MTQKEIYMVSYRNTEAQSPLCRVSSNGDGSPSLCASPLKYSLPAIRRLLCLLPILFACLWTAVPAYSQPPEKPLRRVLPESAEELLAEIALSAELHLVSTDTAKLTRYTSAMLRFVLEASGYTVAEITAASRSLPQFEDLQQLPPYILDSAGSAGHIILMSVVAPEDEIAEIDMSLWETSGGGVLKRRITGRFSLTSALTEIGGKVPDPPPGEDLPWRRLFDELVGECNPGDRGLEKGWHLAEGMFFYQNGYWNLAAESLSMERFDDIKGCFVSMIKALKYRGEAEDAMKRINDMLKLYPDSGPLYALKAWLTLRAGQAEDARMLLEQARLLDVASEGLDIFAEYLVLSREGATDAAERALLRAVESMPGTAFIQIQAARYYWRQARLQQSVQFYRRAIEAGAGDAEIYLELGLALDASGESEAAIEAFMNVFRHRREDISVARHLSSMLRSAGRYEDAIRVLKECVEANPESAPAAATLGDLCLYSWRIDESIEAYGLALERDSSFDYARIAVACAYMLKRQTDKAIELLGGFLQNNGRDARALLMFGEALLHRGKIDEAIENLRLAASDAEFEHTGRIALSNALLQAEDFEGAIREAQLAVSSNPDSMAFAALARAFAGYGRIRDARHAIEQGLKSMPDSPDLLCATMELHLLNAANSECEEERNRLYMRAIQQAERAIDIDPFHLESYLLGGYAALGMHDFPRCADFWSRAAKLDRWDAELAWKLARIYHDQLESPQKAAEYYRRHVELRGPYADEAAGYLQEIGDGH